MLPKKFMIDTPPLRTVRHCRTMYQWAVTKSVIKTERATIGVTKHYETIITGYIGTYFPPISVLSVVK